MTTAPPQKASVTPGQALGWTMIAFLVAILAWTLGQMLDPRATQMMWFAKGLFAIVISGFLAALIAGWIRKAIYGT